MTQTGTEKPTTIDMEQALQGIHYGKKVPIPTRDGSYVSANIFRPDTTEQVPALLCYSIYAKDLHEQDGFPEIWADMLERLPNIFEHSTCSLHTHETRPGDLVPVGLRLRAGRRPRRGQVARVPRSVLARRGPGGLRRGRVDRRPAVE